MRRPVLAGLALVALVAAGGGGWLHHQHTTRVRTLASTQLHCPVEQVEYLGAEGTDTMELYRLEACQKAVTLACMAPDFQCFVVDGALVK